MHEDQLEQKWKRPQSEVLVLEKNKCFYNGFCLEFSAFYLDKEAFVSKFIVKSLSWLFLSHFQTFQLIYFK